MGLPQAHVPFDRLQDPEAIVNWPQTLGRDGSRTPMPWTDAADGGFGSADPWLPIDPAHLACNVAAQAQRSDSALNWTRELIALRHSSAALREGTIRLIDHASDQVVAFERSFEGEILSCVFNLTEQPASNPAPGGVALIATGGADPASDSLPPASAYIARL